jgi:hypothetical protein
VTLGAPVDGFAVDGLADAPAVAAAGLPGAGSQEARNRSTSLMK